MTSNPSSGGDPFAGRINRWVLRTKTLSFGPLPALMGIVNVTPDSFSDGGRYLDPHRALDHALRLESEGADILDVGGQSSRPGAPPVGADEELRRVLPVLVPLCERAGAAVSIDTFHPEVAAEALSAGAEIINDITGLSDPRMVELAVARQAAVCAMHMRGTPRTMQEDPRYDDVVAEVAAYLRSRRDALVEAGVPRERIALDPGIGFGKTPEHNLALLRNMGSFHALDCPLLVGHSRKAFIGKILGDMAADRTPGTLGVAAAMALAGVQILRVHDVAAVRQSLLLLAAASPADSIPHPEKPQ